MNLIYLFIFLTSLLAKGDIFRVGQMMLLQNPDGTMTNSYHVGQMIQYLINVVAKNDTLATVWGLTPEERSLLPNTTFQVIPLDIKNSVSETIVRALEAVGYGNLTQPVDLITGLSYDDSAVVTATIAARYDIPVLSQGSVIPSLSDKTLYPTFSRIYPSSINQIPLLANLAISFSWRYVGVLASDDVYGTTLTQNFALACADRGITILQAQTVLSSGSKERRQQSMRNALLLLKQSGVRIIFIFSFVMTTLQDFLFEPARDVNMLGPPYVYIGSGGVCTITTKPILETGMLCLYPEVNPTSPAFIRFASRTMRWLAMHNSTEKANFGALITQYDVLWYAAKIYNNWLKIADEENLPYHGKETRLRFNRVLRNSTWNGATGPIKLDANGDRAYSYFLLNRPTDAILNQSRPLYLDLIAVAKLPADSPYDKPIIFSQITFPDGTANIPPDRIILTLYQNDEIPPKQINIFIIIVALAFEIVNAWVCLLLIDNVMSRKIRMWRIALAALPISLGLVTGSAFTLTAITYQWLAIGFNPNFLLTPILFVWPGITMAFYTALMMADKPSNFAKYVDENSVTSLKSKNSLTQDVKIALSIDTELEIKLTCWQQLKKYLPAGIAAVITMIICLSSEIVIENGIVLDDAVNISNSSGWASYRIMWLASFILFIFAYILYVRFRASRWRSLSSIVLGLGMWLIILGTLLSINVKCLSTREVDVREIDAEYERVTAGIMGTWSSLTVQLVTIALAVCICISLLMLNVAQLRLSNDHLDVLLEQNHQTLRETKKELREMITLGRKYQNMVEGLVMTRGDEKFIAHNFWHKYAHLTELSPLFFTGEHKNNLLVDGKIGVDDLLNDALGLEMLKDYMRTRYTDENLFFYIDTLFYENRVPIEYRQDAANHICELYIKDNAPRQINISDEKRTDILKKVESDASKTVFASARSEIKRLIDGNEVTKLLGSKDNVDNILKWYLTINKPSSHE